MSKSIQIHFKTKQKHFVQSSRSLLPAQFGLQTQQLMTLGNSIFKHVCPWSPIASMQRTVNSTEAA